MRLIDADELIKEFDPDGENLSPITVRLKIARQPTAYDVDKVVEQLDYKSVLARPVGWSKPYEILTLDDATEIVKAGGVNAT